MSKEVLNRQPSTQFPESQAHEPVKSVRQGALQERRTTSGRLVVLALTLIIVILCVLAVSSRSRASIANVFAQMTQPDGRIEQVTVVERGPQGPNSSIWLDEPMLATFPDQEYLGRLVVEAWTNGEYVFFPTDEQRNTVTPDFLERVVAALSDSQTEIRTTTPWTDEPVMATAEDIPGERFLGRVVVEVWDEEIVVAATGSEPPASLTQRAIVAIDGFR